MSGEASLESLLTEQWQAQQEAPKPAQAVVPAGQPLTFTPEALIQLLLDRPGLTHQQYGAAFGRGSGWFASVLASNAFQAVLDPVRHLIADPAISATLDERFRAVTLQSLAVLQTRLDSKECNDQTVLKAVELGLKASGIGALPAAAPPAEAPVGAEAVANRILEAMASAKARSNLQAVDVQAKEVKAPADGS